jgi:myo-inositol-1(or 4)-monophosphatase
MKKDLNFAINTAKLTAKTLEKHFKKTGNTAREKSSVMKSKYDLMADKIIKKEIEKHYPDYSYITEETGWVRKNPNKVWVIDPLDGTSNYVNGNPLYSISIALWINNEPILGIIEAPGIKERYVAIKNKKPYIINLKNNKKKKAIMSNTDELKKAYVVTCDGGMSRKKTINYLKNIYPVVKDLRKIGSTAIELAWVGMGRADVYIVPKTNIWDIGAGILFLKQAGGQIMDFNLNPYKMQDIMEKQKVNLIATNGKIKIPKINI